VTSRGKRFNGRYMTFFPPIVLFLILLGGCNQPDWQQVLDQIGNGPHDSRALTLQEIDAGLKEALRVGTEQVVAQLGKTDGFNADPAIRILLPDRLSAARLRRSSKSLKRPAMPILPNMSRAAEAATPKAKEIFWQSIREMTIQDVQGIFRGPEDAATRYFERTMTPRLAAAMRPVVDQSLNEVGAVRVYNEAVAQVRAIPYAPEIRTDLTGYVVEQGMAGIFHYLAQEEAAIRQNPLKRTTELLRRVFGGAPGTHT
jgi:hypothetical protein